MEIFEIVKLFDKLIDRCIQLIQERDKQRLEYLNENIDPTFKAFDKVHWGYIETFTGVMDILDKFGDSDDFGFWQTIVKRLERDSAATKTDKVKFKNLAVGLEDRATKEFVSAISRYLEIIEDRANRSQPVQIVPTSSGPMTVRIKLGLKIGRAVIESGDAKKLTTVIRQLITDKLDELTNAYGEADRCYRAARRRFK